MLTLSGCAVVSLGDVIKLLCMHPCHCILNLHCKAYDRAFGA